LLLSISLALLLVIVLASPAQAQLPIDATCPATTPYGSCVTITGIAATVNVEDIDQGCGATHVESVYLTKRQFPNYPLDNYIEGGWEVDRAGGFCQTSPKVFFFAWESNGGGQHRVEFPVPTLKAYRLWLDVVFQDGFGNPGPFPFQRFRVTAGGVVYVNWVTQDIAWAGKGLTAFETDLCPGAEPAQYHNQVVTLDGNYVWHAANLDHNSALHNQSTSCGSMSFIRGSGTTGDSVTYSN
jgi:hypothetical protein